MINISYLNGKKVENRKIISIYNGSFLYGVNCFEGIRAYWSTSSNSLIPFDLDQHLDRLYQSIQSLSFKAPISQGAMKEEVLRIFEQENIQQDTYIRITLFIDGETSWSEEEHISYVISMRSMASQLNHTSAVSLAFSQYKRISSASMPPSVKAGANYLNSRYALLDTKKRGFGGALFTNEHDFISESTGACVFFIKNGALYTPSADCDILVGVTRNRILQLSRQMGIPVYEEQLPKSSIYSFEAAFLAGTMVELKPISNIEDLRLNPGHPLFLQIAEALKKYVYGLEL